MITRICFLLAAIAFPLAVFSQNNSLFGFASSECDHEADVHRVRQRIISKTLNDKILTIRIAATAACCVSFRPVAMVRDDGIYLDVEQFGTECECDCCYEFTYQVAGVDTENIPVIFRGKQIEVTSEKYVTFPVRFRLVNGDTINYVDKYGFKQGRWSLPGDSLLARGYLEFTDDVSLIEVKYYPDGKTLSVMTRERIVRDTFGTRYITYTNWNRYTEYYESGAVKRECVAKDDHTSWKQGTCVEFADR
jgi:hypothetical protein